MIYKAIHKLLNVILMFDEMIFTRVERMIKKMLSLQRGVGIIFFAQKERMKIINSIININLKK